MWTRLGIWCLLGAFFVWVFSGISYFMNVENIWKDLTLSRFLGEYTDSVVYAVPWQPVEVFCIFRGGPAVLRGASGTGYPVSGHQYGDQCPVSTDHATPHQTGNI